MSLASLLNTTISVYRQTPIRDASGGAVQQFALVDGLSFLPAAIQDVDGQAQRRLAQRQVFVTHDIYVDQLYDIRRGDKVVADETGRSFLVHGYLDMAGRSVCWAIRSKEET